MDTTTLEKNLTEFFQSLTVKKTKSTGKIHFFDQDEFLVFDIGPNMKVGSTHRYYYPELADLPEKEAKAIILKTVKDLGFEVSSITFYPFASEKESFLAIPPPYNVPPYNITALEHYRAYKNRKALVPYVKK
jgi:hypothetical protein